MAIIRQNYGDLGTDVQTQMLIAPVLTEMKADRQFAVGDQFIVDSVLYKITTAISVIGTPLVVGTNCAVADTIVKQIGEVGKAGNMVFTPNSTNIDTNNSNFVFSRDGHIVSFKSVFRLKATAAAGSSKSIGELSVLPNTSMYYPISLASAPYGCVGTAIIYSSTGAFTLYASAEISTSKDISICGTYYLS